MNAKGQAKSANFNFLARRYPDLERIGALCEHYFTLDPIVALNRLLGQQAVREPFAAENLRMHADDQHFFVVGSVEDADPPAFRADRAWCARENRAPAPSALGMFEAEYLAALRIDAGHHVPDGAVFSRGIHRLKDQQDGMAVGCVEKLLLRAQSRDVFFQQLLILLLRLVHGLHASSAIS